MILPMIPLGDVVPRRTRPLVTLGVCGILALATGLLHLALPPDTRVELHWAWGATVRTLPLPALVTAWMIEPAWLAGAANIAAVLLFGPAVEDRLGHGRFLLTLVVAAASASALAVTIRSTPALPIAGAAGPSAAVLTAYWTLFPPSKLVWWLPGVSGGRLLEMPALWAVVVWAVLVPGHLAGQFARQISSPPPLAGTLAGLVVGLAAAKLLARAERLRVEWWLRDD
jgi:membrane associated rhomboid family serine protease